jgi:hypothetical protein
LARSQKDKNKGSINFHLANAFNDFINCWGLVELKDPTRSFTWFNNQDDPILEVLDRAMANVEWEGKYPLSNLKIMPKGVSDHNSIRVSCRYHVDQIPLHTSFKSRQRMERPSTRRHVPSCTRPCLFVKVGSGTATCPASPDPTSLLGRAPVPPRASWP